MSTGVKTAAVFALVAILIVGCGTPTNVKAMNAKFDKVDYEMASIEEGETTGGHLERLTRQYIRLVREYDEELGDEEAHKRLADKAFELGPYCLPCVTMLDREAEKY
jgi:hypothetical protein